MKHHNSTLSSSNPGNTHHTQAGNTYVSIPVVALDSQGDPMLKQLAERFWDTVLKSRALTMEIHQWVQEMEVMGTGPQATSVPSKSAMQFSTCSTLGNQIWPWDIQVWRWSHYHCNSLEQRGPALPGWQCGHCLALALSQCWSSAWLGPRSKQTAYYSCSAQLFQARYLEWETLVHQHPYYFPTLYNHWTYVAARCGYHIMTRVPSSDKEQV